MAANLIADAGFQKAILKGTEKAPTVLAVLAQDATSGSIVPRVDGFIARALAALEALEGLAGAISVSGQERCTKPSANPEKAKIVVVVPPSSSAPDIQAASKTIFAMDNLVGVFAANQDAVNWVISATNDGTDLVGFDSVAPIVQPTRRGTASVILNHL